MAPAAEPQLGPRACAQMTVDQDNAQALISDVFGSSSAFDLPSMAGKRARAHACFIFGFPPYMSACRDVR
jgi:hypothetical protein